MNDDEDYEEKYNNEYGEGEYDAEQEQLNPITEDAQEE